MNHSELIDSLAERSGQTKRATKAVLDVMPAVIVEQLRQGNEVMVAGIGRFRPNDREARPGRNPFTGDPIQIPAKRQTKFKAAPALVSAVAA